MKNSLYVPKNTARSTLDNIILNVVNQYSGDGVVLSEDNTWTGTQTFLAPPEITSISNTGILTLPTTSGTLALLSQIPSTSNFVDLTSNQSISGTKTFNDALVSQNGQFIFNSGSAFGTLEFTGLSAATFTLPNSTGALALTSQIPTNTSYVDLVSAQTISGSKTFNNITTFNSNVNSSSASASTSSCNYGLINSQNGMRSDSANTVRLTVGAIDKMIVSTQSFQFSQTCRFVSGSAALPGISWFSDTGNNSGWYLIANDVVGGSINGIQTHQWDSTGFKSVCYRPLSGTNTTVSPATDLASGTCSLQITPSSAGWSSSGIAQLSLGDSNHYVKSTFGVGVEISSVNAIKLGSNGSGFLNIQHGSVAYSTPLGNNSSVNIPITFASPFSSAPTKILCSIVQTTGANWDLCISNSNSVTTTGFNFVIRASGGATTGNCNLIYIAIQ